MRVETMMHVRGGQTCHKYITRGAIGRYGKLVLRDALAYARAKVGLIRHVSGYKGMIPWVSNQLHPAPALPPCGAPQ